MLRITATSEVFTDTPPTSALFHSSAARNSVSPGPQTVRLAFALIRSSPFCDAAVFLSLLFHFISSPRVLAVEDARWISPSHFSLSLALSLSAMCSYGDSVNELACEALSGTSHMCKLAYGTFGSKSPRKQWKKKNVTKRFLQTKYLLEIKRRFERAPNF